MSCPPFDPKKLRCSAAALSILYRTAYSLLVLGYRLLGPLEVEGEDGPIRLGGPKQRATLAILLLNANRVVSIDRIADDLYAGSPPASAVAQVQRQISELRKALGPEAGIETRAPGYLIRLDDEQLDLSRFERWCSRAAEAQTEAATLLREALSLWRGEPLADLDGEPFAASAVQRLGELRLAALEQRIEADLRLGRQREVVPELEQLVAENPLRESLVAQLMVGLYRSGRQADALAAFRRAREELVDQLGLEPGPALRELERRILGHDPALDLDLAAPTEQEEGTLLAVAADEDELSLLASFALPLASRRLLLVARIAADEAELVAATQSVDHLRGERVRVAALTSPRPVDDVLRLASGYDAELVLVPERLKGVAGQAAADVAVAAGPSFDASRGEGIFVPFGGADDDWAALEVGAALAAGSGLELVLVGTRAGEGQRDASRLLADASLAVQRVVGVAAKPLLTDPGTPNLVAAVAPASAVVAGSPRTVLREAGPPVLLVRLGPRPGALAPAGSRTRYTWSLSPGTDRRSPRR
jgi:DNA-binding SARP family transcriptional activator